jgi:DNA-binding HxlR family transcriptional regulator
VDSISFSSGVVVVMVPPGDSHLQLASEYFIIVTVADAQARDISPLASALDAVGDRWTLLIVAALLDGARRFGELQDDLGKIAPNVLTARLRRLEAEGLVVAERYCERPPRFVYELTESGRGLAAPLRMLAGWGARRAGEGTGPTHLTCGTPLEAKYYCPACEEPVADEDAGELEYA